MPASNRERRLLTIAIARLRGEGRSQHEIAEVLGISQPAVSRLLKYAEKRLRILTPKPTFHPDDVLPAELDEINRRYFFDSELFGKLQGWLPQNPKHFHFDVKVFSPYDDEFSPAAAERILDLFTLSRRVGVLWGRTILQIIHSMQLSSRPRRPYQDIECIPLCGDPFFVMFQDNQDFSASQLAALMEKTLTGNHRILPTLTGVPAYFSLSQMKERKTREQFILKEYIHKIPGYHHVFLKKDALVRSVDTLLTGVGIFKTDGDDENASGAFLRERLTQEKITARDLSELVMGDFGGILIPREGAEDRIETFNRGWLGIREHQIARIANDAKKGKKPGVIVVARGERKFEIIKKCLMLGYINELIIDVPLAKKLKAIK